MLVVINDVWEEISAWNNPTAKREAFFKLSNPSWMGWAGGIRLRGFWQVNVAEGLSLLYATERTKGLRIRIDSIRYECMNTAENYVH